MKNEIWKDIENYEGIYQISNYGRVKSLARKIDHKSFGIAYYKEKILSQTINHGYCHVILCKDGKQKYKKVHRLVAEHFIENNDNLPFVNHIDENKQNNCVDNLEWCNYKYNNNYGNRNKKIADALSKKVKQYSLNNELIKIWDSISQVERELNINNSNIVACCKNKRNKAGGYIWKYE